MSSGRDAETKRLFAVYSIEAIGSVSSNFLTTGVFFYMTNIFHWQQQKSFLLSAAMGAVYVAGALLADRWSKLLGKSRAIGSIFLFMAMATFVAGIYTTPTIAAVAVLLYAFTTAAAWPVAEHLVTSGDLTPHQLSVRAGIYNIIWSGVGALIIAVIGLIIEKIPAGVMFISSAACLICALIAFFGKIEPKKKDDVSPHVAPEPKLARQRVLALWLSRVCVPAMYIGVYALSAMLPFLPVVKQFRPATQTLLSSIWLIVRCGAFIVLGMTTFWHTRPRLLLMAGVGLLASFLLTTLPTNLALMIGGQILFGLSIGLIYAASLYFGMVLSEGSTEHGGYHEALIGVGMALGPAMGAAAAWVGAGDKNPAVMGVSGLLGLSLLLASMVSLKLKRG